VDERKLAEEAMVRRKAAKQNAPPAAVPLAKREPKPQPQPPKQVVVQQPQQQVPQKSAAALQAARLRELATKTSNPVEFLKLLVIAEAKRIERVPASDASEPYVVVADALGIGEAIKFPCCSDRSSVDRYARTVVMSSLSEAFSSLYSDDGPEAKLLPATGRASGVSDARVAELVARSDAWAAEYPAVAIERAAKRAAKRASKADK
jgi:hypothetical protein